MQHLRVLVSAFFVSVVFQAVGLHPEEKSEERRYSDLLEEQKVYSQVTPESLSETINFKDGADISDTLVHIFVGLSRNPTNGRIYKRMAKVFLHKLTEMGFAPNFVKACEVICDIIDRDRELWERNKEQADLIADTLMDIYKDEIKQLGSSYDDVAPFINNARHGDAQGAREIITFLAKQFPDYEQLNSVDHVAKRKVLEKATEKLLWWAKSGLEPFITVAKTYSPN